MTGEDEKPRDGVEPARPDRVESGKPSRLAGRAIVFLRWPIVLAWIGACVAVYIAAPSLGRLPAAGLTALVPTDTPAFRAEHRATRLFGSDLLPRVAVVQRDPQGLSPVRQRRFVQQALRLDHGHLDDFPEGTIAVPLLNTLKIVPAARERSTTGIAYLGFPSSVSPNRQRDFALQYARALDRPGAPANATGFVVGLLQASNAVEHSLRWVEIATIALIAIVIGLYLRSLLAPVVTLVAAGISYVLSSRAVTFLGLETGLSLNKEVEPIVIVLLLGIVTDYSVFFLSGMRLRTGSGEQRVPAARRTSQVYLPIVFTAGLLVAAGLTTMLVGSLDFVRTLGPAMGIVVVVSLLVAITFVPASMAILGRALFWPGLRGAGTRGPQPAGRGRRMRVRLARLAKRPVPSGAVAAACAIVLAGAASGLFFTRLSLTPISGLTSSYSAQRGATQAAKGFAAGAISPTELVLEAPGIAARTGRLARLTALLRREPEISAVVGAGQVPVKAPWNVFRTRDGNGVRFLLVFPNEPFGAPAIDDLRRLQQRLPHLLDQSGLAGAQASYAGDTAISRDTNERVYHDLAYIALTVFLVNLTLLCVFLRALVAPILLICASALALAATFGLTTYFFQDVLGYSQLTYYVPLAAGVLLASFGSDYNLFIVGRIWQASRRQSVGEAIVDVAPKASRAISVAAVALALSFATLAIVPLNSFREFAFAMAVGILIDSFVVRSFLIPAMLGLVGRFSWWPGRTGLSPTGSRAS